MRPIERGAAPQLPTGLPQTVSHHRDWCFELIKRVGGYCCYCNMVLDNPQVEHVIAQALPAGQPLSLSWGNMLLACGACNRAKWQHPCTPATHALPDVHNTHLAFTHRVIDHPRLTGRKACVVEIRAGLNPRQQAKASATMKLCQLHRVPIKPAQIRRASDVRWLRRLEAWTTAARCRHLWDGLPSTGKAAALLLLEEVIRAKGFFSVWFDTFQDVPEVKQLLVNQATFPGTAACFPGPAYDPAVRVAGDL